LTYRKSVLRSAPKELGTKHGLALQAPRLNAYSCDETTARAGTVPTMLATTFKNARRIRTVFKAHKIFASILIQVLLFSSFSHANFDNAMATYSSGEFEEARSAFEALAAIGDRSSLFNLGVMHYKGEAFDRNPVKAYVLMKIANKDLEDETFTRISKSIFSKFDNQQKLEAEEIYSELNAVHSISSIEKNIFPKLLDDKDCPPEIVPIKRAPPVYPRNELNAGRMGLTRMEFTISPEGYPRDIMAEKSTSKSFTKMSVNAIKEFLYEPPSDRRPTYGHRTVIVYQIKKVDGEKIQTKRLSKELNLLKESATKGDAIAQYRYASRLNTYKHFKNRLEKVDLQYKNSNKWFTKSAQSGIPNAQYEIGRNMLEGRGCEVDVVNGYKWISAAAVGGYSPAQNALAKSALKEPNTNLENTLSAIGWLRNSSQSENFPAKLLLAWELSTSNIDEIRNAKEALVLIDSDPGNYFDNVRIMETKAAVYAELGDFKKAKKYQKKAMKTAKNLDWEIPLLSARLDLYNKEKPYRGTYY
jgi:TPR repeat protein